MRSDSSDSMAGGVGDGRPEQRVVRSLTPPAVCLCGNCVIAEAELQDGRCLYGPSMSGPAEYAARTVKLYCDGEVSHNDDDALEALGVAPCEECDDGYALFADGDVRCRRCDATADAGSIGGDS